MYIMFDKDNRELRLRPAVDSRVTRMSTNVNHASTIVSVLEREKPSLIRGNVYDAILFVKSKLGCMDAVVDVDVRDVTVEQLRALGERQNLTGARARALLDLSRGRSLVDVIVDHDVTLKSALNAGTYVRSALKCAATGDNLTSAITKLFNSKPPCGASRWTSRTLRDALAAMNVVDASTNVGRIQRAAATVNNYNPAAAFHRELRAAFDELDVDQRTLEKITEHMCAAGFKATRSMVNYDARLLGLKLTSPTTGHEILAEHIKRILVDANGYLPVTGIIDELAKININVTKFMVNNVLNKYELAGRGRVVRHDSRGPKPTYTVLLTDDQVTICEKLINDNSTPLVMAKRAQILAMLNERHESRPTARYVATYTNTSIGTVCNVLRDFSKHGFEFTLSRKRRGRPLKNTNTCDNI